MIYVFLGFVILVISFLIALLTLIREQRGQAREEQEALFKRQVQESISASQKTEGWDQKSQETAASASVPTVSTENSGWGNDNLIRGGEFIVPRSVGDKEGS